MFKEYNEEFFKKIRDINILEKVLSYIEEKKICTKNLPREVEYYRKNDLISLKKMYYMRELKNKKLLISKLIATKTLENIVYALYICHKIINENDYFNENGYKFKEEESKNYEYKVIYLFLQRFLLNKKEAENIYEDLKIKNIQCFNLTYLKSDLNILFKSNYPKIFIEKYYETICKIFEYFPRFVENGNFASALDLIRTYEKILKSDFLMEQNVSKILSDSQDTFFDTLLGEENSYLFKKLSANQNNCKLTYKNIFNPEMAPFRAERFVNDETYGGSAKFAEVLKDIENEQKRYTRSNP